MTRSGTDSGNGTAGAGSPGGADLWSTASVCDAAARLGVAVGLPPEPVLPVAPRMAARGSLRRVRHSDSVTAIFAALDAVVPGDVLLIDDGARRDQACVGDLVALEAASAGVAALVIWGSHRDSDQLAAIGLPVFSLGRCPAGPRPGRSGPAPAPSTELPGVTGDLIVADADGVVLVPHDQQREVLALAGAIIAEEAAQARAVGEGRSIRSQLRWQEYLEQRGRDSEYSFRAHLAAMGGAVE